MPYPAPFPGGPGSAQPVSSSGDAACRPSDRAERLGAHGSLTRRRLDPVRRGRRGAGRAAGRRRARLRSGAPQLPVADRPLRGSRLRAGGGGSRGIGVRPRVGLRELAGGRGADPDPVPRRARGGGGDAPARMAAAAAQAGSGDAVDGGLRGAGRQGTHRSDLDGGLPPRRAAVADRPGALVCCGDQPEGSAPRPPLAQSGVGSERRAGAAGRAGAHGLAGRRHRLRVVGVRPAGPRRGLLDRAGGRTAGVGPAAPRGRVRATRYGRTRRLFTRSASASAHTPSQSCRPRETASSRCSWRR